MGGTFAISAGKPTLTPLGHVAADTSCNGLEFGQIMADSHSSGKKSVLHAFTKAKFLNKPFQDTVRRSIKYHNISVSLLMTFSLLNIQLRQGAG